MSWWDYVTRFFRSRYVLWLEEEVDRLREENRSMLNSLLTRAGVQPVDVPKPIPRTGRRFSRHQFQVKLENDFLKKNAGTERPESN